MNKSPSKDKNKQAEANEATVPYSTLLRDIWLGTCARFTILCLILLTTSSIASASLSINYVDTVHFFLLLPFGLCLTCIVIHPAAVRKGKRDGPSRTPPISPPNVL